MTGAKRLALGVARVAGGAGDAGSSGSLRPEERDALPERASAKRRAEFAAGRFAARAALAQLLGRRSCLHCQGPILPEPGTGRPRLERAAGPCSALHLSITHADGLALAAAADAAIGVDLVTVEPLESSFAREAFVPGELAGWASWLGMAAEAPFPAAVAFAAKEAASKWLGVGLTVPLLGFRVEPVGCRRVDRVCGLPVPADAFRAALVPAQGRARVLEAWLARLGGQAMVALSSHETVSSESQGHARACSKGP